MMTDMGQLEIMNRYFDWFYDRVLEMPGIEDVRASCGNLLLSTRQWVRIYMLWAVQHGFLHVFGDDPETPFAGILWRPIESDKIEDYNLAYYENLFDYAADGDVAAVDFCYAPGHYPLIIDFLKATGLKYTAWVHSKTGKLYLVPIAKMPKRFILGRHAKTDMRKAA